MHISSADFAQFERSNINKKFRNKFEKVVETETKTKNLTKKKLIELEQILIKVIKKTFTHVVVLEKRLV